MFLKSQVGPVGRSSVYQLCSPLDGVASLLGWSVAALVNACAHALEQGKMAAASYPVCSPRLAIRTHFLSSDIVHCFFTVRDQAPGNTSLLSFVSDAAVFPGPLLPKDCGFDPLHPSTGGSHRAVTE